jgi:hypothetical protein
MRRPRLLPGHIALGNRTFFNGPYRLASDTIKDVEEADFPRLRDGIDCFPIVANRDQLPS